MGCLLDSPQESEAQDWAEPPTPGAKAPRLSQKTGCYLCVLSGRQDTGGLLKTP